MSSHYGRNSYCSATISSFLLIAAKAIPNKYNILIYITLSFKTYNLYAITYALFVCNHYQSRVSSLSPDSKIFHLWGKTRRDHIQLERALLCNQAHLGYKSSVLIMIGSVLFAKFLMLYFPRTKCKAVYLFHKVTSHVELN